jgi:Sialic acid synthase
MSIFIVAELGINHNGDMSICRDLIDVAVETGCNAVKFSKRDI